MSKRIPGQLRQRRVAVAYWVLLILLLLMIAYCVLRALSTISTRLDGEIQQICRQAYLVSILFIGYAVFLGAKIENVSRIICWVVQLGLIAVSQYVLVFVVDVIGGLAWVLQFGSPESVVVSGYESIFIWVLFVVGATLQTISVAQKDRRGEINTVVAGILGVMGILLPRLLESYSILRARCSNVGCESSVNDLTFLMEMAIGYAVSLSTMFVLGVFSPGIVRMMTWIVKSVDVKGVGSSSADSHNGNNIRVSASESADSSDKQNDGIKLPLVSLPTSICASQEAADNVAVPVQSEDRLTRSSGLGLAVPTLLMGAAASGLVAGACFSVVNRLFNRR